MSKINKKIRDNIYNNLNKLFGTTIAKKIEDSIYRFSEEYAMNNNSDYLTEMIYESKADELLCIINKNLKFIIFNIKNNKIDPNNIAFLKSTELNVDKYAELIKKKEIDMMLEEPIASSAFECEKCKKSKCNIIEKQVLAADEPATQFITCLECGHVVMV